MKRKTAKQRASEFFIKPCIANAFIVPDIIPQITYERLESFWEKWLHDNTREPYAAVYQTCYKLLITHPNEDNIYNIYQSLLKMKPNTLEHFKLLYGNIKGEDMYNNRASLLRDVRTLSVGERVTAFFKSKIVKSRLSGIIITNVIRNELTTLFSSRPNSDFSDSDLIICDLIEYYSPDFTGRYNTIKNSAIGDINYYKARYSEKYLEKYNEYKSKKTLNAVCNFANTIDYWILKGVEYDDAVLNVRDVQTNRAKVAAAKNKGMPSTRTIEFWQNKGMSDLDAIDKIKQMQTRDLNYFCIQYGETDGLIKFNDMIQHRVDTWLDRPLEERLIINASKGKTYEQMVLKHGYDVANDIIRRRTCHNINGSTISIESMNFFKELEQELPEYFLHNSITGYKGNERWILCNKKLYYVDYIIQNCVIEYNGSFWHADPRKFLPDTWHSVCNKNAKDIWDQDKERIDNLTGLGYNVLTIWSDDVKENKQNVIKKCKEFLDEKCTVPTTN